MEHIYVSMMMFSQIRDCHSNPDTSSLTLIWQANHLPRLRGLGCSDWPVSHFDGILPIPFSIPIGYSLQASKSTCMKKEKHKSGCGETTVLSLYVPVRAERLIAFSI